MGVEGGRSVLILGLVDCQFFCCIIMRNFLVASDFGSCFVMRVGVRFGQESKCPRFTALSRVEGFGLKAQTCRYFYKSFSPHITALLPVCGCLKGTIGVLGMVLSLVIGIIGTSHNPFVWFRYPVSTFWPCLKIWSLSLLNMARQL